MGATVAIGRPASAGRAQRSAAQIRHVIVVGHDRIHLRIVDGRERRVDHQAGGQQLKHGPELVRALGDEEIVVAVERIALDVATAGRICCDGEECEKDGCLITNTMIVQAANIIPLSSAFPFIERAADEADEASDDAAADNAAAD